MRAAGLARGALAFCAALGVRPSNAAPPASSASSATPSAASSAAPRGSTAPLASLAPRGSSAPAASHAPRGSSAGAAPRPVLGADLPRAASPAPAATEWSAGRPIVPTRGNAGRCVLTVLREWLRARCPGMAGAGLVAGETDGVSVRTTGRLFTNEGLPGDLVTIVVLPLRSGQTRVVSFNDVAVEYDSTALVEGGMLSVVWREGRPSPVLAMYGVP